MPLNSSLYSQLLRLFGTVKIANRGIAGSAREVRRPGGGVDLRIDQWGEAYRVCCPFCRESRYRLWVNWRYGMPDPATGGRFRINYLCKCHRTNCVPSNAANRRWLAERVLGRQRCPAGQRPTGWHAGGGASSPAMPTAPPPGELLPLAELAVDHPAVAYLVRRGYGVDTARRFGLSYCARAEPQYRLAQHRIICPVDFDGRRVGWQARYVGEPPSRYIPKYYSSPGMSKSQIFYDFDRARLAPWMVVVEGVTDVWRLSGAAAAILGRDISPAQRSLLAAYSGRQRPVLLMLDAGERARIDRYAAELQQLGVPAVPVHLPGELDPGDCRRDELLGLLARQAGEAGLHLQPLPGGP